MQAIAEDIPKRKRGRPMGSENMSVNEMAMRLQRLRDAGVIQGISASVLHAMMASSYWVRILGELEKQDDWRTITEVMKFHQQMHEGRPAQRIQVTSFGVNFATDEIAKVRELVRELAPKDAPPLLEAKTIDVAYASDEARGKEGG